MGIPDKKPAEKKEEKKEDESSDPSKMKITRVFDFAGESVKVTKEVDKDSKEAKKFLKDKEKSDPNASSSSGSSGGVGASKRPGGIASIMNVISGKKQKMGCLDKSKLDWNNFVKEEGIKEELETHNKGKDGLV